jgi:iron complex transport system substrate-binding protein
MKKWILFAAVALAACKGEEKESKKGETAPNRYALGFRVEDKGIYRDVFVQHVDDSTTKPIQYRLITQEQDLPPAEVGVTVIRVPIKNLVCTSTTHIPHLDYLGETDKLVGFPSLEYISSSTMRESIDAGKVEELGKENGLNLERVAALNPSIVMAFTMTKDLGQLKKVQELGIPVVVNAEFIEQHPLGRAEWIKFTALFFGKEAAADSVFRGIESEYLKIKTLADGFTEKPTVFTGIPYGGIWYLPGGKNYGARFFSDAGCNYLWADNPSSGYLQLSLETVYEKAINADYWIGVASFKQYDALKMADTRFADFASFKNKKVFHYNGRIGATGGSEYFELAYLRPDLILKDLIQITHPKAYPTPDLFFYEAVK